MFKSVAAQTEGTDTRKVSRAVIAQCKAQLNGLHPVAGLLFSADHFEHGLAVKEIVRSFPGMALAGSTASGEMSSAMGFSQDSMCLMLFASDTISMASGIGHDLLRTPEEAVHRAVRDARNRLPAEPSVCFAFPGILGSGVDRVLSALHEALGPGCRLFGGLAGADDFGPGNAFQFSSHDAHSDAVSVLLFSGPVRVASVVSNSWEPVGYKSVVEEASGNRVMRIGGRSALQFYREAFGPYATPLPEMPLAVFDDDGRFYMRSAMGFDEDAGSVDYAIPIAEGRKIQLTEATPETITTCLSKSLRDLMEAVSGKWSPQAAFLFSCSSRRWIMGLRSHEELALATEILPENIPITGFYTFGEIAPLGENRSPKVHNCTLVAVLLGEDKCDPSTAAIDRTQLDKTGEDNWDATLLAIKLTRARESQSRLEMQKESFTNVLRRMSADLVKAKRRIEEQNQILRESLTLAQEVQQNLLPVEAPKLEGFDIAGRSLYCDETGGDYIDYLPGKDGLDVVVGDVSGHGIAAALLMATARALLRMRASIGGAPEEFVTDLNNFLASDVGDSGRFMTLMYLRIDPIVRSITWVRAGHEPGLRYTPDGDVFTELLGQGLALGVFEGFSYDTNTTAPLLPGEIIVLGTDGITEARGSEGLLFGRQRLMEIIRKNASCSAGRILEACFKEVQEFRAGLPREDDETLVIIKAE